MYAEMPKNNEYKAFEKYMNEIGQELGMTRNRADKRAKEIGTTRSAVLQDFIKNKGLLAVPIAAGASGLLVNADRNEEM